MTGMKITVDAAMRARDVSRPHAEHEDLAQASEADQAGWHRPTPPASGTRARDSSPATPAAAAAANPGTTDVAETAETSTATGAQGRGKRRRRRH